MLIRAFGPPASEAPRVDGDAIEPILERFDLVQRIAARHGAERLRRELGAKVAERMMTRAYAAGRLGVHVEAVTRDLVARAERARVGIVLMKFAALHFSGALAPGSRTCSDVDILVPRAHARRFREELLITGFAPTDDSDYEHQLAAITHPSGTVVEIHTRVLGVRVRGARSADLDTLRDERLLDPLEDARAAWVPSADVLVAHAIVHGLVQHGAAPGSYPAFRMLADLADLDPEVGRRRWTGWLTRDVSIPEIDALLSLRGALLEGDLPASGPARDILHHLVAGVLDDRYAASLRFGGAFRALTDRGPFASLTYQAWHAVFPTGAELERIYGPPRGALARLRWRVGRPLDVARRLARYAFVSWRSRRVKTGAPSRQGGGPP